MATNEIRITSKDGGSWLSIQRSDDGEGYSGYLLEASVEIGHGRFSATNIDVQLLDPGAFAKALGRFVTDRDLRPELEGTYESRLRLVGGGGKVFVEFAVGDAFCADRTHEYLFSGSFDLDPSCLPELARAFESLMS